MIGAIGTAVVLALSLFLSSPAHAEMNWKGSIKLWQADFQMPVPKPIGVEWPAVELKLLEPTELGYFVIGRYTYTQAPWTVTVLVTRRNDANPSLSYISVQTTLKEAKHGLVAQCARFDALGAFNFLPPSSCSGQMNGKLVGVSLLSPFARP